MEEVERLCHHILCSVEVPTRGRRNSGTGSSESSSDKDGSNGEMGDAISSVACCELMVLTLEKGKVRLRAFLTLPTRAQVGMSSESERVLNEGQVLRKAGCTFCRSGSEMTMSIEVDREKSTLLSVGLTD